MKNRLLTTRVLFFAPVTALAETSRPNVVYIALEDIHVEFPTS
jgi:hypothetical protein